jgi:hypothetical protein
VKRKGKTTLAEKISLHVAGDTEYERFTDLFRQAIPPEYPPEPSADEPQPKKGRKTKKSPE